MSKVVPLGLRLFLEGVEIPVVSAQVNIQPDTPATAAIQVVPSDSAMTMLPRTLVHLFFLDASAFEDTSSEKDKSETGVGHQPAEEQHDVNRFVAPDSHYKLLFAGQVIGLNYSKTPVSRQLVLQCMDLSINWDTCYQWFADYSVGGDALTDKSHNFVGAGQGLFDNVAGGHKWVIGNILNSKPRSPEYEDSVGLLGGVIHLMEAIGGLRRRGDGFEGYNGVNDFFTIAELRFNLLGMIGAVAKDKTSAKLYASKAFRSWLRNGMTSLGNLMSFRDILNHVNRYIFHHIYPNPAARYIEPEDKAAFKTAVVPASVYLVSNVGQPLLVKMNEVRNTLLIAEEAFETAANTSGLEANAIKGLQLVAGERIAMFDIISLAETLKTDDAKVVISDLKQALGKMDEALTAFPGALSSAKGVANVDIGSVALGDYAKNSAKSNTATAGAIAILERLATKSKRGRKRVKKRTTVPVGSHLFSQLILPETFFVSPPRCNMIFPDQYYSLSFSRNFLREITRLSMKGGTGIIGGSRRGANVLGRNYFAPRILDSEGKSLMVTAQYGGRIILPHEVHSGIIPKFEWVSDGHRWGVKAARQTGREEDLYKSKKVGYLQRLANFNFFLHRWSSRTMQVGGIFNPRLVLGFPSVVLDRAVPPPHVQDVLKKELGRNLLPTQYMGKIASLNHTISQGGGSTTVAMTHCRTHRAFDDEFLGVLVKEVQSKSKQDVLKVEPRLLELQRSKYKKAFIRMLNYNQTGDLKKGVRIPELGVRVEEVKAKGEFFMPVSIAADTGISVANAHPDPSGSGAEDVVTLPEIMEVVVNRKVRDRSVVSVAPEDVMIPGWYSDVWLKANIGKDVYQPLLGTFAITDDVDINQKSQNEMLQRWKNEVAEKESSGQTTLKPEEAGEEDLDVGEVITDSIEAAIDSLGILYGMLQTSNGNVHEFIERYTYRPIANMREILGSQNLEYSDSGEVTEPDNMEEGFHSRAFGDYNTDDADGKPAMGALFPGLSSADIPTYKRPTLSNAKKKSYIRPELDPRGRARARILAYAAELKVSRGLLGG